MILIFGVQVGQGGKLVEADEPIHTQAQENDNQNTGEYLVQHVTVFDSQQVVAQSFLGADPLSDNSAADTVGGRNLQAGFRPVSPMAFIIAKDSLEKLLEYARASSTVMIFFSCQLRATFST